MINGHGDDIHSYPDVRINFSSNVYNHFDHEGLFCHLADTLDDVVSYPEPSPATLEASMAAMLSLTPSEVCVTSGATEAIYLIALAFRRSRSAIVQPTFSEYADACVLHEHKTLDIYSLRNIPKDAELLWICNPNNPTGTVTPKDELILAIETHPDTVFVLDASYAPFTNLPLITPAEAAKYSNVVMVHSMTKEFAIPGLRLGYITANAPLLSRLRQQRQPWTVNQVAINAAEYLLCHSDEYTLPLDLLLSERQRIETALSAMGFIEVWPSDTHILLCRLRFGNAASLKDYLAVRHGILIRDASNFHSLGPTYFRIAVQTPDENDALLSGIAEWAAEG